MKRRPCLLFHNILVVQRNTLVVQHDTLVVQHNTLVIQHNTFVVQHNTLVAQHDTLDLLHNARELKLQWIQTQSGEKDLKVSSAGTSRFISNGDKKFIC